MIFIPIQKNYDNATLEHHTSVALRELVLEKIRKQHYSNYPSRMAYLNVSQSCEDAKKWLDFFIKLGRPTFYIVKLFVEGNYFLGDATKCFRAATSKEENLKLAHK